jgi:carboxypeptidase T
MFLFLFSLFSSFIFADDSVYWMKLDAQDKFERSVIANTGASIEVVNEEYVIAIGTAEERAQLQKMGMLLQTFEWDQQKDFPERDRNFHNFAEAVQFMTDLQTRFPNLLKLEEIGTSLEGRKIYNMRISTNLESSNQKPAMVMMGTHHAREHLSTEMPLLLAKYLVENFASDARVRTLLETREIHIIPMVNPDGVEYDISTGSYKSWRKNRRRNPDGTMGVDLNRNYSYMWGTGGSSSSGGSDTFKGPNPFSEPETQTIKNFVESHENINVLLSVHTFSELILYPWGHSHNSIANQRDFLVHKTMAEKMATWNRYTPQQSSDLYIASGDTTDWSYGQHGIVSFTFELDPRSIMQGGFYPGQGVIPTVFNKNLQPFLYLLEHADNPYRVLESRSSSMGFKTELF